MIIFFLFQIKTTKPNSWIQNYWELEKQNVSATILKLNQPPEERLKIYTGSIYSCE